MGKPAAATIARSRASRHDEFETSHTIRPNETIESATPAGTLNAAGGASALRRRIGSAAQVAAYVMSRMSVLIVSAEMNVLRIVSTSMMTAETRMAKCGVRKRRLVAERKRGS